MILDLYSGAGGWLQAMRLLGIGEHHGYEIDRDAASTYELAGGEVTLCDLTEQNPPQTAVEGLVGSPPCQPYSAAGKRLGRDDPRGMHPLTLVEWAKATQPKWVAAEQVDGARSIFTRVAVELSLLGYHVALHGLDSECYGVPQTRSRIILMAHRDAKPPKPPATHSRYYPRDPTRLDRGVPKWVSMAEALGWQDDDLIGFPRRADRKDLIVLDGTAYRTRDLRTGDAPAATVTEKARSWERIRFVAVNDRRGNANQTAAQPAPTLAFGHERPRWVFNRPSPTIVAEFRPDIVAAPGYRTTHPRQNEPDSVHVTVQEAGILQGFPADWPWSGSKTSRFRQVGNAIPPPMAKAVITTLMEIR